MPFTTLAGTPLVIGEPPADGCGAAASFFDLAGVAVDGAGNVYVADLYYSLIRKITPAGCVTTLVSSSGHLYYPLGLALDSAGNIYVVDTGYGNIVRFNPAGVEIASFGGFVGGPSGNASLKYIAVDSAGNMYVTYGYAILKIIPAGSVTTLAGTYGVQGSADGVGSAAQFRQPEGIAVDGSGNVYVAESYDPATSSGGLTIRKITPAGVVSTFAGQFGVSGSVDGPSWRRSF